MAPTLNERLLVDRAAASLKSSDLFIGRVSFLTFWADFEPRRFDTNVISSQIGLHVVAVFCRQCTSSNFSRSSRAQEDEERPNRAAN